MFLSTWPPEIINRSIAVTCACFVSYGGIILGWGTFDNGFNFFEIIQWIGLQIDGFVTIKSIISVIILNSFLFLGNIYILILEKL